MLHKRTHQQSIAGLWRARAGWLLGFASSPQPTGYLHPEIQARIAENFRGKGLFLPFICTPEELMGGENE